MMRKLLIALAMASASHATIGHAQSAAGEEASTSDSGEIVVTALTPTPLGEGKTTTTVGLTQALNRIGVRAAATLRQEHAVPPGSRQQPSPMG